MKFNKGDKVRAISSGDSRIKKGNIYTVVKHYFKEDEDYYEPYEKREMVQITIEDGTLVSQLARRFELIKPKKNHLPEWL